eukprot:CAMPEP_0172496874 /NCGR_PEP_ID=MMETSP1066-20121228/94434_1 /TAXON_ID=671091 /ORGANISM="Coscinodiscus wailesii, Strain CCMP2513" /LENGTH=418 /DNA_ID=CAMNT_0013269405 /DNA_START=246 /DNA_END=1502 /DNA_ORIENTATION=+
MSAPSYDEDESLPSSEKCLTTEPHSPKHELVAVTAPPTTPPPSESELPISSKPIPFARTLSSPPGIDPSPKQKLPSPKQNRNEISTSHSAHLTPVICNTTSDERNDSFISSEESKLDEDQIKTLQLDIPDEKQLATKPRALKVSSRARTVGNLDSPSIFQTGCIDEDVPVDKAIPEISFSHERINLSRMNRSFGSNKQYRRALATAFRNLSTHSPPRGNINNRTQYQPSRDNSLTEVGLGENLEDLNAIFLPRRKNNKSQAAVSSGVESGGVSHHALLQPIPLDEKQWSIPSIRLANGLHDMSTASYTCSDDEDSLWDEDIIVANLPENLQDISHLDDASDDAVGSGSSSESDEKGPYEWLKQVRESENVLAEAASSKFLTNRMYLTPMVERQALQTLNREAGVVEGVQLWKDDQKGF